MRVLKQIRRWWRRLVEISWEHDPMLEYERFQRFNLWVELERARQKENGDG